MLKSQAYKSLIQNVLTNTNIFSHFDPDISSCSEASAIQFHSIALNSLYTTGALTCSNYGFPIYRPAVKKSNFCSKNYFNDMTLIAALYDTSNNFFEKLIKIRIPVTKIRLLLTNEWERKDNVRKDSSPSALT